MTMLIGLKLDVGFSHDDTCRGLYGTRDIPPFLRELGFDAVETPVGPETQADELREHIARCVDAGLKVSLHPYSEGTIFNVAYFSPRQDNPCRQLHERFLVLAAEAAHRQQYPTVVNIHGAAGTDKDPRRQLLDRTIAFFTWAGQWCRQNAPDVSVTVELQISPNTDEPRQRIGDKYEELLEIAPAGDVGVCWDFGHAYWNTRRYGWPLHPPEALLPHIRHVHCHDVHGGEDHQPLVYGLVPWREFLRLLRDHGFDGRVILEVPPTEFPKAGGLQSLLDSIQALKEARAT
ncbi:MAG: sugar phosphate isomerase/epimerase [Planctomycetes bacterium]|jgi:sugar phosphate isomerase/epimerase|nr:sugar phosphate isomerase/epimerase [Planctomycetota bacterium]